jgi:predicted dehydrogenase
VLRLGFAGAGLIAWAHGLGLRAMIDAGVIDAELGAVYDLDPARAEGWAGVVGGRPVTAVDDLLEACDAVWVCTPTAAHPDVVEAAVAGGVAIFCEKPLATDLAGAETLTAVVGESSAASTGVVPAQAGLVLRSTPIFRALREAVAGGELGAPMAVVFRDDQYFPVQGMYGSTWRGDAAQAGGGCLIEHSIHDVDILRFCLGEVTDVSARTAAFAGYPGVEDLATVSLGFASGARAELVSVWHGIMTRGSTRRVEVFGSDGLAWLDDDFRGPLHVETGSGTEVRACPSPAWVDALPLADDEVGLALRLYVEADRSFVDAVTTGVAPQPDFGEALTAHRLVDAAYRSAASGGTPVVVGSRHGSPVAVDAPG